MKKNISIFISYDFNVDDKFKADFLQNLRQTHSEIEIIDLSFTTPLSEEIWEYEVEMRMRQCDLLVLLVGKHTSQAKGVLKEIEICKKLSLPIHIVYTLQNTKLCTLPTELEFITLINTTPSEKIEESLNTY
jgi:hypothetical protein